MEIFVEILLQVLGGVLQVVCEIVLQLLFEGIAELFGHTVRKPLGAKEPVRRPLPIHPLLVSLGYLIYGAVAGGISIWLFPHLFIEAQWLRLTNLLLTPIFARLIMHWIGVWRSSRDQEVIGLESFAYGFCFAFAMAVVRYAWGH